MRNFEVLRELISVDSAPFFGVSHEDSVIGDGSCDGDSCDFGVFFLRDSFEEGFDGSLERGMISNVELGVFDLFGRI